MRSQNLRSLSITNTHGDRHRKFRLIILAASIALYFGLLNVLLVLNPGRFYLGADDYGYITSATSLVNRGVLLFAHDTKPSVFVMPGYPLWIALFYAIFGVHHFVLTVVRELQMAMCCGTALIIFDLTKNRFGYVAAFLAFEESLFLPDFLLTPMFIFTESLFMLLSTALFASALRLYERRTMKRFVVFAVLTGASLLVRPTIALFPVAILLWMLVSHRLEWKRFLLTAVVGVTICSAMLAPWWVRNYRVYHRFIPFTASTGSPFLIGTFPIEYSLTFPFTNPAEVQITRQEEALTQLKRKSSWYAWNQAELDAGYKNLAREWHRNPLRVLCDYTLGKFVTFFGSMQWIPNYPLPDFVQNILHWIVLVSSGVGLALRRRTNYTHVFVLWCLSTEIVYQIYLAMPRYALPVDILLLPLGSAVILDFCRRILRREHRTTHQSMQRAEGVHMNPNL